MPTRTAIEGAKARHALAPFGHTIAGAVILGYLRLSAISWWLGVVPTDIVTVLMFRYLLSNYRF